MNFTLIICTYMRPKALYALLESVKGQTVYPSQIVIVDGSTDLETETMLNQNQFRELEYYRVEESDRGLTKQRNFGISKVASSSEVVCFLDDDIILKRNYFKHLEHTYTMYPKALGVGGYITNEVEWTKEARENSNNYFTYDGWTRKEPKRFKIRKRLGLAPDTPPGVLPSFSHMRAIGFLPPSGKVYQVEAFMGGVASYRKSVFKKLHFSSYFEGYGLYEDADFCLRLSKMGDLYVNTLAQCEHHHAPQGRPNSFKYGKMVLRNGWYVWRLKYSKPSIKSRIKWHSTEVVLTLLTLLGAINSKDSKNGIVETFGRCYGWWSLLVNKPKIKR